MTPQNTPSSQKKLQWFGIFLGIAGMAAYAASKFVSGRIIVLVTVAGVVGFMLTLAFLAWHQKSVKRFIISAAISLVAVVAGTYLILFLFLLFFQDAVANHTSIFFQPQSIAEAEARAVVVTGVEPFEVTTSDGLVLKGWLAKNSSKAKSPLVIYFGGSGSEASQMIPYTKNLRGWSVALVNYRGFGLNAGTPGQADVLADATRIYDALATRTDIDAMRIVSMGYSLGTGVAVHLASQRPVAGVILAAPYDSLTIIGVKQTPLYKPLSGIMKRYFDSASIAPQITAPLFCLVGGQDQAIPPELSMKLVDLWGGTARVEIYEGEDHDFLIHENSSWDDILSFLEELGGK